MSDENEVPAEPGTVTDHYLGQPGPAEPFVEEDERKARPKTQVNDDEDTEVDDGDDEA